MQTVKCYHSKWGGRSSNYVLCSKHFKQDFVVEDISIHESMDIPANKRLNHNTIPFHGESSKSSTPSKKTAYNKFQ